MDYRCLFLVAVLIAAIGQATSNSCLKLSQCTSGIGKAAKDDKKDELCQKMKTAVACVEENIEGCDIQKIAEAYRKTIASLKKQCSAGQAETGEEPVGAGDACIKLSNCQRSFKGGYCVKTRSELDCFIDNVDKCEQKSMADAFRYTMESLNETYHHRCVLNQLGKNPDDFDVSPTCANLTQCVPQDAHNRSPGDKEARCSLIESMLDCIKQHEGTCETDRVVDAVRKNVAALKASYVKKCNGSGKPSASVSMVLMSACAALVFIGLLRPSQ